MISDGSAEGVLKHLPGELADTNMNSDISTASDISVTQKNVDTGVCSSLKCKNIAASTLRRICINAELIHKIVTRLTLQKELGMLMRKPTHPVIGHVQLLRKMDQHVVKSVFHVNILHSICEDSMGQDGIAVVEKISNGRLPNIITKRAAHHAYASKPKREGRNLCSRNCNFCILLTLVYFSFQSKYARIVCAVSAFYFYKMLVSHHGLTCIIPVCSICCIEGYERHLSLFKESLIPCQSCHF